MDYWFILNYICGIIFAFLYTKFVYKFSETFFEDTSIVWLGMLFSGYLTGLPFLIAFLFFIKTNK